MRRGGHGVPAGAAGSGLAEEAEGYLLARTHRDQARREAAELCAQLPWLTAAEAEDLTVHFVRQRLDVSRRLLRATIQRAAELRGEYEARYAELRRALLRRHAAGACAVLACAASVSAVVHDLTG
ncbi:hypothetical protein [Streptomyces djakartensis]|uniref:hypothetical protein n=1 Tax=Streptomyces djakartensis TaxID=68193 RepID=UPI0034DE268D